MAENQVKVKRFIKHAVKPVLGLLDDYMLGRALNRIMWSISSHVPYHLTLPKLQLIRT